ncbi:MAG: YCF48-related protein [Bacteroidota bacterium]
MKQNHFILILFTFFSVNVFGQEGWTKQTTAYSPKLHAVYAIDALNVWASGSDGLIIHSMDGGETWDSIPNGASRYLTAIEFINADTGFVAGRDSETGTPNLNHLLQRTRDGGLNWEFIHLVGGQLNTVFDMDFVEGPPGEPMRGFCVGGLANVWISNDYGDTWDRVSGDCGEGNFNSCFFADSITGWFVGTPSNIKPYTIMFTDDGCKSFVEQPDPNEIKLNGVSFGSELKGIAVGLEGIVMYTSDGGTSWETCTDEDVTGGSKAWSSVHLTETGKAWAVGHYGLIVYSNDWGHTWEPQTSGVTDKLSEVYFINDSVGWIVGGLTSNVILHTKNGGGGSSTGIEDFIDEAGTTYSLEQNCPNPFSSSTQINYTLGCAGHISLTVYDISGRKIQTLVNEYQASGKHTVDWDAGQLSNGLYFCELKVEQSPVDVKKMMLER